MARILAWHFLADDGMTAGYRGSARVKVEPGQVLTVPRPVKCCRNGLHGSVTPLDALDYAPGGIVCRVKIGGQIDRDTNKLCGSTRECLWMLCKGQGESCLRAFARWNAIQAILVSRWDAPAAVKTFLTEGKESQRATAWAAARAAARDAAWAAARAAARDAAWAAARDAAWAAAWAAARDAARAAARDAARAAARDAANKQLELMLNEAHEGRTEWLWTMEAAHEQR